MATEDSPASEQPRHAGLMVRLGAALIDAVIMGAPVSLIVSVIFRVNLEEGNDYFSIPNLVTFALVGVITIVLWVNWDGRTPGKKILRIRIVSYPNYESFSYGVATVRTLLSLTGVATVLLGYLAQAVMIGTRADKRGYHDLIAKTCVIHDQPEGG